MALCVMIVATVFASCEKDNSIVQTQQYNERESGQFALGAVKAVVVQNGFGPVIIEGVSATSSLGWYLDKSATADSQTEANQIFSKILVNLQTINHTAFVSVQAPSGASLLSLEMPSQIPCVFRKVNGTSDVSYLDTTFIGENVSSVTIMAQNGSCELTGTGGDASVELALPDSGRCRIATSTGNIALKIPTGTSSLFSAQTGGGAISHSGIIIADSLRSYNSLAGKLGAGRGDIQLSTGKGNISITGF